MCGSSVAGLLVCTVQWGSRSHLHSRQDMDCEAPRSIPGGSCILSQSGLSGAQAGDNTRFVQDQVVGHDFDDPSGRQCPRVGLGGRHHS